MGCHIKGEFRCSVAVHSLSSKLLVLTHFFVPDSHLLLIISASAFISHSFLFSITLSYPLFLMCCTLSQFSTSNSKSVYCYGKCSCWYDQVLEPPGSVLSPSVSYNFSCSLPPGITPSQVISASQWAPETLISNAWLSLPCNKGWSVSPTFIYHNTVCHQMLSTS